MRIKSIILWSLAIAIWITSPSVAQPTFDCSKAESSAEELVCADIELQVLDQELARLYFLAVEGPNITAERLSELRAIQRGWIKGRNECWKASDLRACVLESYLSRIADIRTGYFDARQDDTNGISSGPFPYACQGLDAGVSATFVTADVSYVYLSWTDQYRSLTQSESASGVRYIGEFYGTTTTFWTEGDNATLTDADTPAMNCIKDVMG